MRTSHVKNITVCAMCVALCYVLPLLFHATGVGSAFSPMHIPVLLCGLVCGGVYGGICGILGPLLSSLLSGMPPVLMLTRMIPELFAYGLIAGICMRYMKVGNSVADTYISLIAAMCVGRIVGGIATFVFYKVTANAYNFSMWFASYFAEAVPGIIVQLIVVPLLVLTLQQARVIPPRYQKTGKG